MFTKFAKLDVLEVKSAPIRAQAPSLQKYADFNDYRTDDGYMYVRVRAISSRVNKNHDGWPSEELKKSYRTFIGKPIFVDHHNGDPKRARGVVVDADLHVEDSRTAALDPYYANAPIEHMPPTWIELLLEVDAKAFPKLAKAIIEGDIDGVSMGANVERSKCSHCGNWATSPDEYCSHIRSKGAFFDKYENGKKTSAKSYEDCYGVGFFEISFVFDPADETALFTDQPIYAKRREFIASIQAEGAGPLRSPMPGPHNDPESNPVEYMQQSAPAGGTEDERVYDWKLEQLMRQGYTPQEADQIVNQGLDYHDLQNLMDQGATRQQAWDITAKIANNGASAAEDFHQLRVQGVPTQEAMQQVAQKWFGGDYAAAQQAVAQNVRLMGKVAKTADRNPPPQAEMQTAPDKVDTLRQEQVCPICGSDMEDGVCEVCSYEEPPEGFDTPDLQKAKEVDKQMRQEDAEQAAQGQQGAPADTEIQNEPGAMPSQPQGGPGLYTSKTNEANTVSSEKTSANTQGGSGRINTQERPILPVTRQLSDKPKDQKTVSDSKTPVESKTRNENKDKHNMSETQKTADGATALGEGVQAEKRVDVEGVGAVTGDPLSDIQHENVEKAMEQKGGPATDTWTGDEGDSLGQHEPVSSEPTANDLGGPIGVAVSSDQKTADTANDVGGPIGESAGSEGNAKDGGPTWDSSDNGFPDHDPARVDLAAPLAEEVGPRTMTDPNEEFRSLKEDQSAVTQEGANQVGGPIGEPMVAAPISEHHPKVEASVRAQVIKAIKLAEAEEELGLVPNKWDRVAELEDKSEAELDAALDVVSKVKTAGLSKKASAPQKKVAGSIPSLQNKVTASVDIAEHSVEGYDPDDTIGW